MARWRVVSSANTATRDGLQGQAMAYLFQVVRRYVNFFQPSFDLIEKFRDGATTVKRYSPPATPVDRLMEHDGTGDELKAELNEYRSGLDPVQLRHSVREAQSALVATTAPAVRETPSGESLEQFLAKLPGLWQRGEVRPTHVVKVQAPRHWRTRKDPFEGVWTDVLAWLQAEPDATGTALMARLQPEHQDRLREAQLRTLQRRLKEWRGIMVKELVYAGTAGASTAPSGLPEMALAGTDSRSKVWVTFSGEATGRQEWLTRDTLARSVATQWSGGSALAHHRLFAFRIAMSPLADFPAFRSVPPALPVTPPRVPLWRALRRVAPPSRCVGLLSLDRARSARLARRLWPFCWTGITAGPRGRGPTVAHGATRMSFLFIQSASASSVMLDSVRLTALLADCSARRISRLRWTVMRCLPATLSGRAILLLGRLYRRVINDNKGAC